MNQSPKPFSLSFRTHSIIRALTCGIALSSLAACGGGGDGGDDNGSSNKSPTYQLVQPLAPSLDKMLEQFNAQGQKGYAYMNTMTAYTNAAGATFDNGYLLVKDYITTTDNVRFQYALDSQTNTPEKLLTQINQWGKDGYIYKTAMVQNEATGREQRNLYVRRIGASTKYSFEGVTTPGAGHTVTQLAEELRQMGAKGFRFYGPMTLDSVTFNLYVNDGSPKTYAYSLATLGTVTGAADVNELRDLLKEKGANGQLWRGALNLDNKSKSVAVFERDSMQTGKVEYTFEKTSLFDQLNARTDGFNANVKDKYYYWSDTFTADGVMYAVSVKNGGKPVHPLTGYLFP